MKGHHPTPDALAAWMVRRLFEARPPTAHDRVLYPGCGTAPFARAVEHVCAEAGWPVPEGYGVEANPALLDEARAHGLAHVAFAERDFLADVMLGVAPFDYVVGNPPYVPIEALSEAEKTRYRAAFRTASGRFDLYLLFFERALDLLAPGGRLAFVTPEKWTYVATAAPLRRRLTQGNVHVESIHHLAEDAFPGLVTYPCVTTVHRAARGDEPTQITRRDGTTHAATLPPGGTSWAPALRGVEVQATGLTLGDVTVRVSPGMATGADGVFVTSRAEAPPALVPDWIRPTVSGRELTVHDGPHGDSVLVCPYRDDGRLVAEGDLGAFGAWAERHRARLEQRSCVQTGRRPWYAWHETPPMADLLRPKIVFQDIAKTPRFWAERTGDVIPRHSVYYLVPADGVSFEALLAYLNTPTARAWLEGHCQRAAHGFLRLQSRVLRKLPVPTRVAEAYQGTLAL